jgi:cytochrome c-type biogenesis protein CcmH/NrfF
MRNRIYIAAFVVVMAAAVAARSEDPRPTARSVGDKVMCLCGCVAILNQCPHHGCSTHEEVQGLIQKLIDEGKSEPEIYQALVARYGTKILAAPPAKGFNLAAWVLPGLGLILGLFIVVVIARRLLKPAHAPVTAPSASVDSKVLAAMEEEMKTAGLGARDSGLGTSS